MLIFIPLLIYKPYYSTSTEVSAQCPMEHHQLKISERLFDTLTLQAGKYSDRRIYDDKKYMGEINWRGFNVLVPFVQLHDKITFQVDPVQLHLPKYKKRTLVAEKVQNIAVGIEVDSTTPIATQTIINNYYFNNPAPIPAPAPTAVAVVTAVPVHTPVPAPTRVPAPTPMPKPAPSTSKAMTKEEEEAAMVLFQINWTSPKKRRHE